MKVERQFERRGPLWVPKYRVERPWERYARRWRQVEAAIAFDAESDASSASSTTTLAWSHTVNTGSNRLLAVSVHTFGGTDVTGITFGAQSFTKVRHDVDSSRSEIWYLVAPAEATDTITITWSASVPNKRGSAVSFFGVDQASPLDAQAGTASPGSGQTSFSTSITTVADNAAIVDSLSTGGVATITMGSQTNRVERFNGGGGTDPGAGGSTLFPKTPAGAQTMNWTLSAARRGGLSIASFKPAAAGSPWHTRRQMEVA